MQRPRIFGTSKRKEERKMQKQTYKAILSILIATLLLVSIIPFAPVQAVVTAIDTPKADQKVYALEEVWVNGTAGVGELVKVYWETEEAQNLLGEEYAIGGDFSILVTIPEDLAGYHHILLRPGDPDLTPPTDAVRLLLVPKITLTPSTGLKDDTVTIGGTGFGEETTVTFTWAGSALTTSPSTVETDTVGSFSCTFKVPDAVDGRYTVTATDDASPANIASAVFRIGPAITLDPEEGPSGTVVDITGRGFTKTPGLTVTITMSNTTTDEILGTGNGAQTSFSGTLKNPPIIAGSVVITATVLDSPVTIFDDGVGGLADLAATVSGTIDYDGVGTAGDWTLVFSTAPDAGTEIKADYDFKVWTVNVYEYLEEEITMKYDGTFVGKFIVPTLDPDTYTVYATDATKVGNLKFEVTGKTGITLTPVSGAPGDLVTIEGINFTAIANTEVTIYFGVLEHVTLETNKTGGFKETIEVPSLEIKPYIVRAEDEYLLWDETDFTIAMTTLSVWPKVGPTGTKVMLVGGGFTVTAPTFNVTIDDKLMLRGEDLALDAGSIVADTTVYVPTVPVGDYIVTAMDKEGIIATASFEVTETTELVLTPPTAPIEYNVTIEANYFVEEDLTPITVRVYNETWEADLEDIADIKRSPGGVEEDVFIETNETGSFIGWFLVPEDLIVGESYTINATDDEGLTVEITFKVVQPTVDMYTRYSEYMRGDSVSFYIKSTFKDIFDILVEDPVGGTYKLEIGDGTEGTTDDWVEVEELYLVRYDRALLMLPTDAELGTWTWETEIRELELSGTFKVVEAGVPVVGLEEIIEDIEDLSKAVDATAADIGAVSTATTNLRTAVDDLDAAMTDVASAVADISAAAEAAEAAAADAKAAADAANTTSQGISMAVYGAMGLSALAAIAAIVAVITLQRKVAG